MLHIDNICTKKVLYQHRCTGYLMVHIVVNIYIDFKMAGQGFSGGAN